MKQVKYSKEYALLLGKLKTSADFVSGEELSNSLNMTRAGLWKKVNNLRSFGYKIEGSPSKGYRLLSSPDIPYPWEVLQGSEAFWRKAIFYRVVDSTNTQAVRYASSGADEGTVIIAERQTSGRGRLGRRWHSPASGNIYMSVILKPDIPPYYSPQLTLAAGLALARAVQMVAGLKPEIKWPNDLLIDEKKFSGILTELNSEADRVNFIILGIGVNLNSSTTDYPEELTSVVTTLRDATGRLIPRIRFVRVLLKELKEVYQEFIKHGFMNIKNQWEEYFCMRGESVIVSYMETRINGKALGIDNTGALLLRLNNGEIKKVLSGDVIKIRRKSLASRN